MAVKFGVLVPQGWHLDLEDISDPEEKFEAMVQVATTGAGPKEQHPSVGCSIKWRS